MAGQTEKQMSEKKIAREWIQLMISAKKSGITPQEIRHFLTYVANLTDHAQKK